MADAEAYDPPVRDDWKEACIFDLEDVFPDEDDEALGEVSDEPDDGYEPDDGLGSGDADGPLVRYNGEDWIEGVPTRDDILAKYAGAITEVVRNNLDSGKSVFFMPTDVEETNEYSNGYPVYTLRLFGVLMNGAKAEVTVTGIDMYFDVRVPERLPAKLARETPGKQRAARPAPAERPERSAGDIFDAHLRRVLADANVSGVRIESIEAFPIRGYNTEPKPYKRIHLSNLQQRKKAIAAVRAADLETASDDRSSYYRKVAREYGLPLCEWAILSNYEFTPGPTEKSPLCSYILRVPVESYRPLIDPMAAKEKREAAAKTKAKAPLLLRDRTLVLAWDIETDSDRGTGDVPDAQHKGDNAFMIAMTVHWKDDPAPLKQVLLVDVDAAPDRRWTTVVCGTPQNVLKAFALVYRGFAPEIMAGFNDSNYDWPFIFEKARQWKLLAWMVNNMSASPRKNTSEDSVQRWNYNRDKKIKISAEESFFSSYLRVSGCVPQDVRVCYKKLFPKSETPKAGSLKFYLEISGLPGKADMPFKRMWHYHRESLALAKAHESEAGASAPEGAAPSPEDRARAAEHMRQVGHYCIIDALRCQQLLVRRNVVNDYRELGSLAYVSLFDCHYYAGGMKVCNLLGAYAHRRNILFSMIPFEQVESGKYPGAYVFPPEKGLTPNPERVAAIDTAASELRVALAALDALRGAGPRAERSADEASKLASAGAAVAAAKERLEHAVGGADGKEAAQVCEELTVAERAQREAASPAEVAAAEERVAKARATLEEAFLRFACDRPVTGLDFASLYPSLIMTYNLSPEKILLTEEEAHHWQAQGRSLHKIEFQYNGRTVHGWSIRHNNVPENIGLYPAVLIDLFNKRAEVKGVLGKHGAVKELIEAIHSRVQKAFVETEVARGIPKEAAEKEASRHKATHAEVAAAAHHVLAAATAERERTDAALAPDAPPPRLSPGATLSEEIADLKRLNKNAKEQIEGIHRLVALAKEKGTPQVSPPADPVMVTHLAQALAKAGDPVTDHHLADTIRSVYEETCFDWTGANTKQNALKVLMNTFYGEAGNALSPFFLLQLAGGVTSAGVYNIKRVADFVQGKGFRIKYGDTDSLYLVCPAKYFSECDSEYALGRISREEWWSAMVRITMRVMNMVRDEVNVYLKSDNGSPYLKMAYEEVLYPVDFDGKKKYFGIPHLNEVNFRPKKLFIRGIEVVKQGQPGLARDIGNRIMWACMALDNKRPVLQIVEDVLRDAVLNSAQWKFDHFIKSDAWKPHKNNQPVHRFIARMRARHAVEVAEAGRAIARGGTPKPYLYDLPEAGERFSYIIAKQGAAFDLFGRKSAMKKGDRMEFSRAAKELGLEVDVAFYMISYVVGLCARFINGDSQFQAAPNPRVPEKKRDEACQKAAKRYLENFVKSLSNLDSGMFRKRGCAYRRAYGQAATAVRGALVACVGESAAEVLHGTWLDYELLLPDDGDENGDEGENDDAVTDTVSKTVTTLWDSAGTFADDIVASDGNEWYTALALRLGIEKNGSDSCPPSPRPLAKTAPAAKTAPLAKTAPAAKAAPAAKTPAAAKTAPAVKTPAAKSTKGPATRLYAASGNARATRKRPAGSITASHSASSLDRQEAALRTQLAELIPTVSEIAARYEADMSRLVHHLRLREHGDHPEIGTPETNLAIEAAGGDPENALLGVAETDRAQLLELRQTWYAAVGLQLTRKMKAGFATHLARLKDKRLRVVAAPSRTEVKKTISDAAAKLRVSGEVVSPI
jgi:DNA polymerase elongation subunit (family B)